MLEENDLYFVLRVDIFIIVRYNNIWGLSIS